MKYLSLLSLSVLLLFSCSETKKKVDLAATQKASVSQKAAEKPIKVIKTYPHDESSFTQGLFFYNNELFESAGQYGASEFKKIDLATGKALRRVSVLKEFFAEGAAELNGKMYQLTWESGVCFVYDSKTLEKKAEYRYSGEGWGLTNDATKLFLSDGSSTIRIIDPQGFKTIGSISVKDGDSPVRNLNELELINGKIYANIWQTNNIAVIDTASGAVIEYLNCDQIANKERGAGQDVLNGIAYNQKTNKLYLTGKYWKNLYEIEL